MNRQSIDVGAQHHGLAGTSCIEQRDDTGVGRATLDLETKLTETLAQLAARLVLAEADLGVAVKMPAQLDNLIEHRVARQRCGWMVAVGRLIHESRPGCIRARMRARTLNQGWARA